MKILPPYPPFMFMRENKKEREKLHMKRKALLNYQAKCLMVQEGKFTEAREYYIKSIRCIRCS